MTSIPSRELEIFTKALRLPTATREAFLVQSCGNDPALRQRIEALLKAYSEAGDFLEQPAGSQDNAVFALGLPGEKPGDRIGRYRLLQQIGEGGCGVVYMAEQEEPVRRRVALKIIKPGMDTKSVIARFEAERQALALMDHPSIAKVFDAGATESGRPYFVMELIRGTKITEYCDQHALSTKDRLQLFVQVCQAVQHAHQKGIIHRDLKPSNILVTTTPECEALPVVIDFGIAKATTNQRLTDKTLFTAFEMLIGTPAYMSPEQTALTSVDVDTRTDIYSLGVLLYELLTGSTPFDTSELLKAGLDEVRKVIREREPPRPSARLSKLTSSDLTDVAHRRHAEPPALIRSVRGDLDWIVMRALEKDRARRYETANGLAADVKRFLANETVAARPPTAGYRFRKTVARHKLLFGFLGAITLLLVVSLTLIAASLARERRARREAQAETEKSRQVTRFLEEMLQGVGPSAARGRDTTLLREVLDKAADRIGRDLSAQPEIQAELHTTIGQVYQQLGLFPQAEAMQRSALAAIGKIHGSPSTQVATALSNLASVLLNADKRVEAESDYRAALAMRQQLLGPRHPETVRSMKDLGSLLRNAGRNEAADPLMQETLALQRQLLGDESLEVADTLYQLGRIRLTQERFVEAEAMERESLAIRRKLLGPETVEAAFAMNAIATIYRDEGEFAKAEALFPEVLALRRRLLGNRHPQIAATLSALGLTLQMDGKYADSEAAFREAISIQEATLGKNHQDTVITEDNMAFDLRLEGKLAEAESIYRDLMVRAPTVLGRGHRSFADMVSSYTELLLGEKKYSEADQLHRELIPPGTEPGPDEAPLLQERAEYSVKRKRWREAAEDQSKVVGYIPDDYTAYHRLAPVLAEAGDTDAYAALCRKILARYGHTADPTMAEHLARDCALLPAPNLDLPALARLAEVAVVKGKGRQVWSNCALSKAMVEYRLGHFDGAIAFAGEALAAAPDASVKAMAYPVLAMAHQRLGHGPEAREFLQRGRAAQRTDWPETETLDLNWHSWIFVHLLMREATALVPPPPATTAKMNRGTGQKSLATPPAAKATGQSEPAAWRQEFAAFKIDEVNPRDIRRGPSSAFSLSTT